MGLRERLVETIHQSQQSARNEQSVATRLQLAAIRDRQASLDSLAPELEGRLHISTSLKVVEDQARKILGNPPNHSKNTTRFCEIHGDPNYCQYQGILLARATAGKKDVSTLNGSWEEAKWFLRVFTYMNWGPARLLTIGGEWWGDAAHEGYPIQGGTTRPLATWTPDDIGEEMFQYFQRTLLH